MADGHPRVDGDSTSDEADTRPAPWAGVVLAGGGSTRFGDTDKLLAELDGTPLVRRATDRLVVVARPGGQSTIRDLLAGSPRP